MNKSVILETNSKGLFTIQVFLKAGSVFENAGERGLSHLLEHMMFKSKKNRNVKEILVALNALGGTFNAITNKDYTTYYIKTVANNWKQSVDMLETIVFQPCFKTKELQQEKKVVVEEFLQYENDTSAIAFEKAYAIFYGHQNPYGHSVKGDIHDIMKTTSSSLMDYYKKHYKECLVYVNCPSGIKTEVKRALGRKFNRRLADTWSLDVRNGAQINAKYLPMVKLYKKPSISQNVTVVMFQGFPHKDVRNITLGLLWDILTGSLNSLLMMEIREKRGLVYGIRSFNDTFATTGVTGLTFSSSHPRTDKIIRYIFKTLHQIKQRGLSDSVFSYSKASYINKLKYQLSDFETETERSMMRHVYGCKYDEPYVLKYLMRLNNHALRDVCKDVFDFSKVCIVSIGDYKHSKKLESSILKMCAEHRL